MEDKYKLGFWTTILLLIGFIGGIFFAQYFVIDRKLAEAARIGGVVVNNKVFDMTERVGK
jgi:hypothetical protein